MPKSLFHRKLLKTADLPTGHKMSESTALSKRTKSVRFSYCKKCAKKCLHNPPCNNRAKKCLHNMEIRIVCKKCANSSLHNSESSRVRQNYTRCKKCAKKSLHNSATTREATHMGGHNVSGKKIIFLQKFVLFSESLRLICVPRRNRLPDRKCPFI